MIESGMLDISTVFRVFKIFIYSLPPNIHEGIRIKIQRETARKRNWELLRFQPHFTPNWPTLTCFLEKSRITLACFLIKVLPENKRPFACSNNIHQTPIIWGNVKAVFLYSTQRIIDMSQPTWLNPLIIRYFYHNTAWFTSLLCKLNGKIVSLLKNEGALGALWSRRSV